MQMYSYNKLEVVAKTFSLHSSSTQVGTMDNTFQEFVSRNNTFKVAHAGYTYSRRSGNSRCDKAGNKVHYFYYYMIFMIFGGNNGK
jgi:hypothetical protein